MARSSTIRDINRQIILNYVREREPISRAEIARETALQRSTVSTIVEALKDDGLIEEIGAGQSTGGRRPTLLRLRASASTVIGVDISPTHTTVAASDLAGRITEREVFTTGRSPKRVIQKVIDCVREIEAKDSTGVIEGIGVSLPGLIDPGTGRVIFVPYFQWRDLPIAEEISSATGLQVIIDNDANAAALAELWFGSPEVSEARDFILVLVAEGVGTGVIIDGQIYRGKWGGAGEFGHMVIGQGAPIACSCGNYDCWEAFSSARAALARYASLSGHGGSIDSLDFAQLIARALNNEKAAVDSLLKTAHYLGIGISNLIVGLSPEAVVVSGPITQAWQLIADELRATIDKSVRRGLASAHIVRSTLGDQPTLVGAISLVLARKFASAAAA